MVVKVIIAKGGFLMKKQVRQFEQFSMASPFNADIDTMKSPTYGEMSIEQVCERIVDFINGEKEKGHSKFKIAVGTDSQAFATTKVVAVIAVHCEGYGGIYFYKVLRFPKLTIHDKILNETVLSLNLATKITPILESLHVFDDENVGFQVHCDVGESGDTNKYIGEITGMVKACAYECVIKPYSFAASGIANKYSK